MREMILDWTGTTQVYLSGSITSFHSLKASVSVSLSPVAQRPLDTKQSHSDNSDQSPVYKYFLKDLDNWTMTKPTEEELLLLNQAVKNEKIVSFMMFLVEGVFLGVVAFFGIIGKIVLLSQST